MTKLGEAAVMTEDKMGRQNDLDKLKKLFGVNRVQLEKAKLKILIIKQLQQTPETQEENAQLMQGNAA